jgi:hypothetical protein
MSQADYPQLQDGFGNQVRLDETGVNILTGGNPPGSLPFKVNGSTVPVGGPFLPVNNPIPTGTLDATGAAILVPTQAPGDNTNNAADTAFVSAAIAAASGSVSKIKVSLTSAQVLALLVTPIQLLPAPGVGKFIVPVAVTFEYVFETTPYTSTATLAVYPANSNPSTEQWFTADTHNFLTLSTSAIAQGAQAQLTTVGYPVNSALNVNLAAGGSISLGDGTLNVYVTYTVETA